MLGPPHPFSVVIVHADHRARERLVAGLSGLGLGTSGAATGIAGVEQALGEPCDAVVVGLPLPDMAVGQFATMIRAVGPMPIVAVIGEGAGVVEALDSGADATAGAYASAVEIAAQLRAVSRRAIRPASDVLTVGDLVVDAMAREATVDGREVELSRKEFDLLHLLASRQGKVVTKRELMSQVWNQPYGGPDKTVDVHLSWLRRKLGESAAEPRYLRTVRGVGIKLVDPGA